jgi:hypothetical protein
MMTLFHKAITVGWANAMYDGTKVTEIGSEVDPENKQVSSMALFSVAFMVFCHMFILNVFIGIVISTFNREESKISKKNILNDF